MKKKKCEMCGQRFEHRDNEFCQDCEERWIYDQGFKPLNNHEF